MKKKIIILMTLTCLCLAGCGKQQDIQSSVSTETQVSTEKATEETSETISEDSTETEASEPSMSSAALIIEEAEKESEILEKKLAEDASLTQLDMNNISQEIYNIWHNTMNELWNSLDEETQKELLQDQRSWIMEKERKMGKAGAEYGTGSMATMAINQCGYELIKERINELADYFN